MPDPEQWRRLLFAATGGLAGFFILLLARGIALGVALQAISIFGSAALSGRETLILLGLVPALLILGAGITAWALGASLWRGLLTGVIALGVFALLEVGQANYSPFNERETLAFVGTAFIAALISIVGRARLWGLAAVLGLALAWAGLRLVLPGSGFAVSLLAWFTLPLVAAFSTMLRQNRQAEREG